MRLLYVVHNFPPNSWAGAETHTMGLAMTLASQGVTAEVLLPVFDRGTYSLGQGSFGPLTIWTLDMPRNPPPEQRLMNQAAGRAVVGLAQERGMDLIHFQHLMGFTAAPLAMARQAGIPALLTLHDFWFLCHRAIMVTSRGRPCPGRGEENCLACLAAQNPGADSRQLAELHRNREEAHKAALNAANRVLGVSNHLAGIFHGHGFDGPGVEVFPLGVFPFEPPPRRSGSGRTVFACLGTINQHKGTHLAVEAMQSVEGAELHLWGKPSDQAYFAELKRRMAPLAHKVFYRGPYQAGEQAAILAQADAVVIPSLAESYCLVLREALLAGRPVVASKVGGMAEGLRHGVDGLLFPPGDATALAGILARLAADPGEIKRLAANIRPPRTVVDDAADLLAIYGALKK